jgi:nondiscriminating aspartyl-tRNA synthetase
MRPPVATPTVPTRTLAADVPAAVPGIEVTVRGNVHRRRELARIAFLVIRDRSGLVQVVVEKADVPAAGLPPEETPVQITGRAAANPQAPGGTEITAPRIEPLSDPALTPPFELWRPEVTAALPTQLDHGALAWRHPHHGAVWQVAHTSLAAFRGTLRAEGFTEIQTPKIVGSATESGANVFTLDYFGSPAYLAQSPQLYKQQLVGAFERVFETGPVFRAEPHDTVRHLAQYTSLDAELGFIEDHREVLGVLVRVLRGMVAAVGEREDLVEQLEITPPQIPEEVPVLHFADALRLVGADPDEPDLAPEHERALGAWAREERGSDVLAVEAYPLRKRPFYTHPWTGADVPGGPWSNSFDLLFRGVELVTGGQRLHRHQEYLVALGQRDQDPEAYADYLEVFAHGMPPHGGFAIGLERWVSRLIGVDNVREAALFPRDLHRLRP